MSFKAKLFSGSGVYLGANIINAGIPFLLLPILTRVLTPADYAMVALFGLSLNVLAIFTGLSVHGAIGVRYFELEKKALAEYVAACVGILLFSTLIVFCTVLLAGELLEDFTGIPSGWILVAVVVSGLQFIGMIRLSLWQASGEVRKYGLFQIYQSLSNGAISLGLILLVGMAWEGRVLGQVLAIAIFGLVAFWWLMRDGCVHFYGQWRSYFSDALRFGIPLMPHVLGGLLIVTADRFIIVGVLDLDQAGLYTVALQIGQIIGLVASSFNSAYSPWLMKSLSGAGEVDKIKLVRGTYLYFVVIISVALVFGIASPSLINLFVGESYSAAGELVIYTALGFAFGGCYYMVAAYIFFKSKTVILALVTFISGALNIPLMYILLKNNGISGAGQAYVITQAFVFLAIWWVAQRIHPMPWLKALKINSR